MTNEEVLNKLNSYSQAQITEHNRNCELKVYNEKELKITTQESDDVDEVMNFLNSKTQEYIDLYINPNLSSERKLSGRPC